MKLTRTILKRLLIEKGFTARRSLGQNFLVDPNFLSYLIRTAGIEPDDLILEIGSGPGWFTSLMARHCGYVWAVEIDRALFNLSRELFGGEPNISFINADILDKKHNQLNPRIVKQILESSNYTKSRPIKIISNLPYARATAILLALLEKCTLPISEMYLMMQKEIAERLVAKTGDASYNALSVLVHILSEVKIVRKVPGEVFFPKPKVTSALVLITPKKSKPLNPAVYSRFKNLVQAVFRYRRKTINKTLLASGLIPPGQVTPALKECGIQPQQRPAEISPETYIRLSHLTSPQ